jgi:hypothetical protein
MSSGPRRRRVGSCARCRCAAFCPVVAIPGVSTVGLGPRLVDCHGRTRGAAAAVFDRVGALVCGALDRRLCFVRSDRSRPDGALRGASPRARSAAPLRWTRARASALRGVSAASLRCPDPGAVRLRPVPHIAVDLWLLSAAVPPLRCTGAPVVLRRACWRLDVGDGCLLARPCWCSTSGILCAQLRHACSRGSRCGRSTSRISSR